MPPSNPTMASQIDIVQQLQGAFLDAWVVVDGDGVVVEFNRLFFALFPRRVARNLKGQRLPEALKLRLGEEDLDPIQQCVERDGPVRYDEVDAEVVGGRNLNLIVSATPLGDGESPGALLLLRDVTDEAQVQTKYKQMLQEEADAKARLEDILRKRTQDLLDANDRLNAMQAELMQFRKGLLLS